MAENMSKSIKFLLQIYKNVTMVRAYKKCIKITNLEIIIKNKIILVLYNYFDSVKNNCINIKCEVKMKKNKLIFILVLFFISLIFLVSNYNVKALSKYGSRGEEVKNIQTKLKQWGYYDGNVDGIYGSKTYEAVKKFQNKNGLKVDGIAGEQTLNALGIQNISSNKTSSTQNNNSNLYLLFLYCLLSHLCYLFHPNNLNVCANQSYYLLYFQSIILFNNHNMDKY